MQSESFSHLKPKPAREFPITYSSGPNVGEGSPRTAASEVTFCSTETKQHLNSTDIQPQVDLVRQKRRCPTDVSKQSDDMGTLAAVNTDLALGLPSLKRAHSGVSRMTATVHRSATNTSPGSGVESRERVDCGRVWLPSSASSSTQLPVGVGDGCPPFGMLAVLGRRREMEDFLRVQSQVITVPRLCAGPSHRSTTEEWATYASAAFSSPTIAAETAALHYFGVFDGHGGVGAAQYCSDRLHINLAEEMDQQAELRLDPDTLEQRLALALPSAFCRTDDEIGGKCPRPSPSGPATDPVVPDAVGTTATVAVVGPNQIVVANCGDSRAVLCRGGVAMPLSIDHKPDRPDEMQRVKAAGGRVVYFNGYRVLGVLAMSRAIGDRCLKPYVIATPEITCTNRTAEDECIIMASDGLWDVLTNEEVCEIARKCILAKRTTSPFSTDVNSPLLGQDLQSATAATILTKIALARGSTDNISVLVINLSSNLIADTPTQGVNMKVENNQVER